MKVLSLPRPMRAFTDQQNSENTRQAYRRDLKHWCLWQLGRPFTVDTAVAYKDHLLSTYSAASAQRMFNTVRAFYSWMQAQGKLDANPFLAVKAPIRPDRAPNVPTDLDVARILKTVDRWDGLRGGRGARDYAILMLLLNGLRASEVCDLRWCDYLFTSGAWCVRVVGKGGKERFVPVTTEAQEAMEYYMDSTFKPGVSSRGEREQPMFHDILGERMSRHQIAAICTKYGERANVPGFTPHSFRHHYGKRLYRVSRDVLGVGKLMGHARPETTKVYANLDLADVIETARLDPRNTVDTAEYHAKA
jgi:integrase/recombinase XerD